MPASVGKAKETATFSKMEGGIFGNYTQGEALEPVASTAETSLPTLSANAVAAEGSLASSEGGKDAARLPSAIPLMPLRATLLLRGVQVCVPPPRAQSWPAPW
jgi:hypothetical protein